LSRRDDLWSWYFVALDFLGEELEWRTSKYNKIDTVKLIKANRSREIPLEDNYERDE
jgi:hypothetical protein